MIASFDLMTVWVAQSLGRHGVTTGITCLSRFARVPRLQSSAATCAGNGSSSSPWPESCTKVAYSSTSHELEK